MIYGGDEIKRRLESGSERGKTSMHDQKYLNIQKKAEVNLLEELNLKKYTAKMR